MTIDSVDRPSGGMNGSAPDRYSGPGVEDTFSLYSRRVQLVPMLTRAEERALFRRKEAGDDDAKRLLVEANLRLVIWIARQYVRRDPPLLDIIQEGNLALATAVEKFDHRLGFRLSTYATLLIRQAIERAAERYAHIVPVPVHVRRQIRAVRRSHQTLLQRLGREPQPAEIAEEAGLDVRRAAELLGYEQHPLSLESPWEEGQTPLGDLLEDTTSTPLETTVAERLQKDEIETMLSSLDDRLRRVLELRFGLSGQSPRTHLEVGRQLGVTPQRARQLEVRALENLRAQAPGLRAYLEVA